MTPDERYKLFEAKVNRTETCWLWVGATSRRYGNFWTGEKFMTAHRYAYERANGPHRSRPSSRPPLPQHPLRSPGPPRGRDPAGKHRSRRDRGRRRYSQGQGRLPEVRRPLFRHHRPRPTGAHLPRLQQCVQGQMGTRAKATK